MPDPTAFDDIYREFRPKIERYLERLVGKADAADLTQTVFLKVQNKVNGDRYEKGSRHSIASDLRNLPSPPPRNHPRILAYLEHMRPFEPLLEKR